MRGSSAFPFPWCRGRFRMSQQIVVAALAVSPQFPQTMTRVLNEVTTL